MEHLCPVLKVHCLTMKKLLSFLSCPVYVIIMDMSGSEQNGDGLHLSVRHHDDAG